MKNRYLGILFIILSAFSFSLMNVFVRLAGDLPFIEKGFFRNIVAFFLALVLILKDGKKHSENNNSTDKKERKRELLKSFKPVDGSLKFLLLRAICGTVGLLCNFYAVDHLVIADASLINRMSPFFAMILSYFILKEKVTPFQISIVVLAIIGCLFVIRPSVTNVDLFPSLIGLLGGLGAGVGYTMVRKLGSMKVKSSFVVLFFSGFSCLVTLPFMIAFFKPMSLTQFVFLMLAGISATGGQFSVTQAYFHAPAKEISVFDYSQILFSAILGYFILEQIPDVLSFIGYAIIIIAGVIMFLHDKKLDKIAIDSKNSDIEKVEQDENNK